MLLDNNLKTIIALVHLALIDQHRKNINIYSIPRPKKVLPFFCLRFCVERRDLEHCACQLQGAQSN